MIDSYREFSAANRERCESPAGFNHPLHGWSEAEWLTAITGELGEAAGMVKELLRHRDGVPGKGQAEDAIRAALKDEIADVAIYLDLLAQRCGFNLLDAMWAKFHRTSDKIGYSR